MLNERLYTLASSTCHSVTKSFEKIWPSEMAGNPFKLVPKAFPETAPFVRDANDPRKISIRPGRYPSLLQIYQQLVLEQNLGLNGSGLFIGEAFINTSTQSGDKIYLTSVTKEETWFSAEECDYGLLAVHCPPTMAYNVWDQLLMNLCKVQSIQANIPPVSKHELMALLRRTPQWTGISQSTLSTDQQFAIASAGREIALDECSLENNGEGIYQAMLQGPVSLYIEGFSRDSTTCAS